MTTDKVVIAKMFKALCDENRVAIVQLLQSGEKCACNISDELGIAQSKLSYHMKILCDSGIVESWYVGKWTHYQISETGSAFAIETFKNITSVNPVQAECSCEEKAV